VGHIYSRMLKSGSEEFRSVQGNKTRSSL
jgi:hypothetical protein